MPQNREKNQLGRKITLSRSTGKCLNRWEKFYNHTEYRLDSCLKKYAEDPVAGKCYLMRLIFATAIRSVGNVNVVNPTLVKGSTDERAIIVERVTSRAHSIQKYYIDQEIQWLVSVMNQVPK